MQFAAVCHSHSPLRNVPGAAPAAVEAEFEAQMAGLRAFIGAFAPDLVVQFGDDHLSGFSFSLMPPFCVGVRGRALGDFDTSAGPLRIDEAAAIDLVTALHGAGVDAAAAWAMLVDHGFTQSLDLLFGGPQAVSVVPVFINCGGAVRPPFARVQALGEAVGRHFRGRRERVLFLASGGLSHDPPLPQMATAGPEAQARMIAGVNYDAEALRARTQRVLAAAQAFARGEGGARALDEAFDREFLDLVHRGDFAALAALDDATVNARGGGGAAELRLWHAAFAALAAASPAGAYDASIDWYRPVPEWFCAMAVAHASPRAA